MRFCGKKGYDFVIWFKNVTRAIVIVVVSNTVWKLASHYWPKLINAETFAKPLRLRAPIQISIARSERISAGRYTRVWIYEREIAINQFHGVFAFSMRETATIHAPNMRNVRARHAGFCKRPRYPVECEDTSAVASFYDGKSMYAE